MQLTKPPTVMTDKNDKLVLWIFWILIHIPLALVVRQSSFAATVYAMITLILGLWFALFGREARRVVYVAAYIAGAEVLWRMSSAHIFWEFGKYAIVTIMLVYLLRTRQAKMAGLPILYFLLLVVSIPLTIFNLPWNFARDAISFNLSGPLSLAVSVIFFLQVSLDWSERVKMAYYFAAPIVGIGSVAVWRTIIAQQILFSDNSNFTTSGGFGPNQVSAILGLGALLFLLLAMQSTIAMRWVSLTVSLILVTLSVLTFSRGGMYNLVASFFIFVVYSLNNARLRNTLIPILLIGIFAGSYFIYPKLEEFTGGAVTTRFSDTSTTGRYEIMQADLEIWKQTPLLGVGPGMAVYARLPFVGKLDNAHTEYTRMLAEHGVLGLLAILFLPVMAMKALRHAPQGLPKAWVAAILTWPLIEMTHAAMRVAAIGFMFGLAMALWPEFQTLTDKGNKYKYPSRRQLS